MQNEVEELVDAPVEETVVASVAEMDADDIIVDYSAVEGAQTSTVDKIINAGTVAAHVTAAGATKVAEVAGPAIKKGAQAAAPVVKKGAKAGAKGLLKLTASGLKALGKGLTALGRMLKTPKELPQGIDAEATVENDATK